MTKVTPWTRRTSQFDEEDGSLSSYLVSWTSLAEDQLVTSARERASAVAGSSSKAHIRARTHTGGTWGAALLGLLAPSGVTYCDTGLGGARGREHLVWVPCSNSKGEWGGFLYHCSGDLSQLPEGVRDYL